MRVITPLMTSTYLDLTKDTTLGVLRIKRGSRLVEEHHFRIHA